MKTFLFLRLTAALALAAALVGAPARAAGTDLPGDSLYRLPVPLTDLRGDAFTLMRLRGAPALISMFYGDCKLACPVAMHGIENLVSTLPPARRERLAIVLVSLDPARDTPTSLRELAREHGMTANWHLAVGKNDSDTRAFAAAIGLRYRTLPDGGINHTTRLVLTDSAGRVIATQENMDTGVDPAMARAVDSATRH
ncbi:SCO family protein [Paludibacterium paludis]|uniref:Protein SCO1/2 n=1 Tax=Paludibacterium paludis TaxID=1225769 RepID=A0A918P5K4_9NEIS|nr:SCO family protein [Paludibacterium paludis]GGY19937.1 hypothetical protein GCM10011289_24270 [Paludibacterium paludis]